MGIRAIDANALVASLEESYKELRKLFDETREGDGAKEIYQGELITFLEAILRTKRMPTLDLAPVVHGEWVENDTPFTRQRKCSVCGHNDNPKTAIKGHFCWYCGAKMDGGKED